MLRRFTTASPLAAFAPCATVFAGRSFGEMSLFAKQAYADKVKAAQLQSTPLAARYGRLQAWFSALSLDEKQALKAEAAKIFRSSTMKARLAKKAAANPAAKPASNSVAVATPATPKVAQKSPKKVATSVKKVTSTKAHPVAGKVIKLRLKAMKTLLSRVAFIAKRKAASTPNVAESAKKTVQAKKVAKKQPAKKVTGAKKTTTAKMAGAKKVNVAMKKAAPKTAVAKKAATKEVTSEQTVSKKTTSAVVNKAKATTTTPPKASPSTAVAEPKRSDVGSTVSQVPVATPISQPQMAKKTVEPTKAATTPATPAVAPTTSLGLSSYTKFVNDHFNDPLLKELPLQQRLAVIARMYTEQ